MLRNLGIINTLVYSDIAKVKGDSGKKLESLTE